MKRIISLGALVLVSGLGVAVASEEIPLPVREGGTMPAPAAPRVRPALVLTEGEPLPVGDAYAPPAPPEAARPVVGSTVGLLPVDEAADPGRTGNDKSGAAPLAIDDYFTVKAGTTLTVAAAAGFLVNDFDPEGDPVSAVAILDNVDHGTLAAYVTGSFSYTPVAGFTGYDYFDCSITDGTSYTARGRIHLQVVATDRPPVAQDDAYCIGKNLVLDVAVPGFLANDFDPDGDSVAAVALTASPAHGSVSAFVDGHFSYTPATGFTGTDSFTYQIAANGAYVVGTATITVFDPNRAPLATADYYYVPAGGSLVIPAAAGFLRNDIDPDGDAVNAISISDGVDHGTLSAFVDGRFNYTPGSGYTGVDRFTYQMTDGRSAFAAATVTILVGVTADPATPVPLPPLEGQRFGLSLPTPNPFNPATRIDFRVEGGARTTMRVFDVRGALVRTLVDGDLPAGDHSVQWDGRDDQGAGVGSGTYFVALACGSELTSRKITLVK